MDNLRTVIKELFCHVSCQAVREQKIKFDDFDIKIFGKLGNGYHVRYSNDELYNMYYAMENEFCWQNHKWRGEEPQKNKLKFHVFDALIAFDMSVLIEENGEPKCQYPQLLRWRDLIVELEEDLFITSYLAYKDVFAAKKRSNFFWSPVIGHNNRELNRLLQAGVAENHFHLKGSAPHFHLSWISMMNDVQNPEFYKAFEAYDNYRLSNNVTYDSYYKNERLSSLWLQAALIRIFLFSVLKDTYLLMEDYYLTEQDVREVLGASFLQNVKKNGAWISLNEFIKQKEEAVPEEAVVNLKKRATAHWVAARLSNVEELHEHTGWIQENIDYLKDRFANSEYDYCLCEAELIHNPDRGLNEIITGERWFMYRIFRKIFGGNEAERILWYGNWFYLYLVIKANIRKEMVQANINVGFDNFRIYQDRKEKFVEGTIYEEPYLKMAVRDTIYNQHIASLEARVAPKNTPEELEKAITRYDAGILSGLKDDEEKQRLKNQYFYVVHFIKKTEHYLTDDKLKREKSSRHSKTREIVEKQAKAIAELRESGSQQAERIHGIDASASEIWCRAEVFAQAFRYLKNHVVDDEYRLFREKNCRQLMATYHVGEDFLDITDGLRAIDEAIHFLNLQCGDRLGHALALGVDVDDWYEGKAEHILINKMGYLDNLVWLYGQIRKYNLTDCGAALEYIQKRYDEYFAEIYRSNLSDFAIASIIDAAGKYFDEKKIPHNYCYTNMNFGINQYYDSWKLRGDNPELYREGFLKIEGHNLDYWDDYGINKNFPDNYRIRYHPEAALLYYAYHYNDAVKMVGDQMIDVRVNPAIREAVKKVQYCMQKEISDIGIGIETNPSSNYLIGTFRRYDKHPIVRWYNLGLTNNNEELEHCPQLDVSVNTDDQGVFATYIENEYAYLALAMEKCKDKDGNKRYNKTMILQWLDNIRKSGISQAFQE